MKIFTKSSPHVQRHIQHKNIFLSMKVSREFAAIIRFTIDLLSVCVCMCVCCVCCVRET